MNILPQLKLFNTETRSKEDIVPHMDNTIFMYTCGPTVYNFAHIGNFRTYVFEDLLRRTIKFFGMKIDQAMNLTDIDDKTIKGAIEKGISLNEYTDLYIKAFFDDIQTLLIEKVEHYPRATEFVPQMIKMIQKLIDKDFAYKAQDGSIYFSIEKFPKYGRLSHLHIDELKPEASERVFADEYEKENVADFVLWKSYDPERDGKIFWESPFGPGRPGWHIECSAMATSLLGETIDIHVGGVDNMFPHHENEIAQSECCNGKTFVRHWLHSEHLLVDNKKMSKSLGNFFTLRDLLNKGYTGKEVRYMLIQAHYRMQLNFTFQGMDAVRSSMQRLSDFIFRLREIKDHHEHDEVLSILETTKGEFVKALADDLNVSLALASIFEMVRKINILCDEKKIGNKEAKKVLELLEYFDKVLCILPLEAAEEEIPEHLVEALEERQNARKEKNWKLADECRDRILKEGYIIEDTPQGARLKKAILTRESS